jgi:flagellar motor protein MotB
MLGYRLPHTRRQRDEGEKPFWISYADLMTAMMVLFLVIMSVSLLVVLSKLTDVDMVSRVLFSQESEQHEQTFNQLWQTDSERDVLTKLVELQQLTLAQQVTSQQKLMEESQRLAEDNRQLSMKINRQTVLTEQRAQRMVDVLAKLQAESKHIKSCNISVEQKKDALTIMFSSADPLRVAMFDSNSHQLHDKDQQCIREFVPSIYHQVAEDSWFKLVAVEGFTDTNGTYLHNLGLSLKRAQSVVCAVMSPDKRSQLLSDEFLSFVQDKFLVGGFSFNSAKANKQESRRVELRLDFKTVEEYDSPNVTESPQRAFDRDNLGSCLILATGTAATIQPSIPTPSPLSVAPQKTLLSKDKSEVVSGKTPHETKKETPKGNKASQEGKEKNGSK